jgi:hypothetical protein
MHVNGVGGERLLLKNVARASESSAENSLPALCNPLPNAEACERTVAQTEARARVGYPTLHRLSIFCMAAVLAPTPKSKKAPPLMGAPLLNILILFWGALLPPGQ